MRRRGPRTVPLLLFGGLLVIDLSDHVPGDDLMAWSLPLLAALVFSADPRTSAPPRHPGPRTPQTPDKHRSETR